MLAAALPIDLGPRGWGAEPSISIPLVLTIGWYLRGLAVLHRRARHGIHGQRVAAFIAGWVVLVLALASPLDEASDQLFTAHMIQHELLMAVAAPLLVLGHPTAVFLWGLPRQWRLRAAAAMRSRPARRSWQVLARPFDAWLLHGVAIWVWHIPPLFQATLTNDAVHAAQHLSFLGSGVLFWWSIFRARRAARGLAIIYLFTTAVHTGVLGALMAFAHRPWYPAYTAGAALWGLTALSDQQLAGLIMWIPAGVVYMVAALVTMRRWLEDSEWSVTEAERIAPIAP